MKRICSIYKSPRKNEMYLYVDKREALSRVPEGLLAAFGPPQHAFDLLLTPERKLAREDIDKVLANIENQGYHRRLLLYKGTLQESDLLGTGGSAVEQATQGYGVGCWHLCEGRPQQAGAVFEQIVAGDSWPAFGFIAAEAELARAKQSSGLQVPSFK